MSGDADTTIAPPLARPAACLTAWCARRSLVAVASSVLAFVSSGCQTGMYSAKNLPAPMVVAPAPTQTGINLVQVGGGGTGTAQIGPGDLVQISIVTGNSEDRLTPVPARIAHDGTVMIPLVGIVSLAGLDPIAAEQRIAAAAIERGIYQQPHVTLTVTEPAVNHVTVLGEVLKPGVVKLPRGSSDLATAIAAAGGLSKTAGTQVDILHKSHSAFLANQSHGAMPDTSDGVQLAAYNAPADAATPFSPPAPLNIEGSPSPLSVAWQPTSAAISRIDLAMAGSTPPTARRLEESDVVMVRPKEMRVIHVMGLVRKPDQIEVDPGSDVRVLDAIAIAGGTSSPLADKVYVIRRLPNMSQPAVIKLTISGAKKNGKENLLLTAGDMVSVESTPATLMVDTVSKFFRMAVGLNALAL